MSAACRASFVAGLLFGFHWYPSRDANLLPEAVAGACQSQSPTPRVRFQGVDHRFLTGPITRGPHSAYRGAHHPDSPAYFNCAAALRAKSFV